MTYDESLPGGKRYEAEDIPEDVESVVRTEAEISGLSLNRAFLNVLKRGAQQSRNLNSSAIRNTKGAFSRFCGVWKDDETAVFDGHLLEQRVVDEEMWQ
ncbi:MAG: hypothetical protein WCP20_14555 [Desulfuromonadales bacterium]